MKVTHFFPSTRDPDESYSGPPFEFGRMRIQQSIECPLTTRNTVMLDCGVQADHGRGVGTLSVNWRRLCQGWSFSVCSSQDCYFVKDSKKKGLIMLWILKREIDETFSPES